VIYSCSILLDSVTVSNALQVWHMQRFKCKADETKQPLSKDKSSSRAQEDDALYTKLIAADNE
jgi:hypothetical protein